MTTSSQEHDSPVYITYPELLGLGIRYSRKHLLALQRDGKFPQARQLSANRIAWLRSEVLDYLNTRPVSRAALVKEKRSPSAGIGDPGASEQ